MYSCTTSRPLARVLALGLTAMLVRAAAAVKTPIHIVHLMADDTGFNDLGFKNSMIDSPNIDRLAMEGIRLTRHHAFKVCSPSRASFHTGRMAYSMGLYDNSPKAVPWIKVNDQAVPQNFTLLPQLLKTKGYATHAVGKWHLGYTTKAYTPTHRGYDTFFGYYSAMTEDYWAHSHSVSAGCSLGGHGLDLHDSSVIDGLRPGVDNGTYEATLFGDRAVDLVSAHAGDAGTVPFFMYLAFHNEHDPHQAPLEALSDDLVGHITSDTYKVTAALIKTMDVQVGRVVAALNASGMLANSVIGFSADNGGPLDHANNWPFRGGKHTFWEGGVRSEAFIWSPLLPASRKGTEWAGLAHVADWFYTYSVGIAEVPLGVAQGSGPFPDDAHDLWGAFNTESPDAPSPRTEVVHMVHSPLYYPGNCSLACFSSRNCPAVITSGEMKLMLGFVGDPRIVPLNFTAGERSPSPVRFGTSGGHCNVAPPQLNRFDLLASLEAAVAGGHHDAPDPQCARGVLSPKDNITCCAASCGTCGGTDCMNRPGGKNSCCRGVVDGEGRSCDAVGPPCKKGGSSPPGPGPAPAPPGPYADRCTSPGLHGSPKPTKDGLCVNGCLFNLTADPTESNNLYSDPAQQGVVNRLKMRLQELGAAAPPWAAVPEVAQMSGTQLDKAKCDAAKRFGALAPIDI